MKRINKSIFALLMVVTMLLSTGLTALAADSTVTYTGRKTGFEFAPGSTYTATDLFDEFKNVMPGDTLMEEIKITNKYSGCDYIKVWMRAVLHDESGNPISPKVLEELTARKASDTNAKNVTELAYMNDFLSQLELTVWKGDMIDKNIIYKGSPDSLETGFEDGNVYLGSIGYKSSITLNAELKVPITLGNEYADRIGEVDWGFVIEERNEDRDDDYDPDPTPGKKPQEPGTKVEVIEPIEPNEPIESNEPGAPQILPNLPKTGDDTVIWPYVLLLGLGIAGMILTMFKKRKKENH